MAKPNNRRNRMRGILGLRTRKDVMREARARTRLETAPTGRELAGQMRASRQDSRNINSWYQQYQSQMERLRGQQGTAFQNAQANARANAEYLSGQNAARSDATQSAQDRSAAIRGAVADPSASATESAAEAQRRALSASGADRLNAVTLSAQSRLAGTNMATELGRQADQRQERNRRAEIQAKKRDLARDRGATMVKNLGDLIRSEREQMNFGRSLRQKDRYSNAMIQQAQLGLAGKQASANATLGAAQLYSGAKIKAAKIYARGQNGQPIRGKDIQVGMAALRTMVSDGQRSPKWVRRNRQQVRDALITNENMDPRLANIVIRRYLNLGPRVGSAAWAKENKERSGR